MLFIHVSVDELRLLPPLGYCDNAAVNISYEFMWGHMFSFLQGEYLGLFPTWSAGKQLLHYTSRPSLNSEIGPWAPEPKNLADEAKTLHHFQGSLPFSAHLFIHGHTPGTVCATGGGSNTGENLPFWDLRFYAATKEDKHIYRCGLPETSQDNPRRVKLYSSNIFCSSLLQVVFLGELEMVAQPCNPSYKGSTDKRVKVQGQSLSEKN